MENADYNQVAINKDKHPVLFLSSGYEPMFKTDWRRAITAIVGGRAEIVETHKSFQIFTAKGSIPFPTVVRFTSGILLGKVRNIPTTPKLTKRNLHSRDNGQCQYCDKCLNLGEATIDHVVPKSKGGTNTWENVVLACAKCNQRKGNKLLENTSIRLSKKPIQPTMDKILFRK